jgi:hypothetical protein
MGSIFSRAAAAASNAFPRASRRLTSGKGYDQWLATRPVKKYQYYGHFVVPYR